MVAAEAPLFLTRVGCVALCLALPPTPTPRLAMATSEAARFAHSAALISISISDS